MAAGRLLFLGPPSGVVPWFSGALGYSYQPQLDGLPCDWLMDLVSLELAAARKVGHAVLCGAVRCCAVLRHAVPAAPAAG